MTDMGARLGKVRGNLLDHANDARGDIETLLERANDEVTDATEQLGSDLHDAGRRARRRARRAQRRMRRTARTIDRRAKAIEVRATRDAVGEIRSHPRALSALGGAVVVAAIAATVARRQRSD
jgi:hypothetical protein